VIKANGIALDEQRGRLFIGDRDSTTVRYFDTSTFSGAATLTEAGNVDISSETQTVMGIAIDQVRNFLYSGNAYGPFGSKGKLVKHDLNTSVTSAYTLPGAAGGDNIVGVAVDEDTGNVYTSTGNQGVGGTDTIIVFDSNLNVLKNDIGDVGNPTGITIPRAQISFNPLSFSKTDSADPIASGSNLGYELCYDNAANTTAVTSVVITDDIPAGTTFVSATGPFTATSTTITWNIASVAAGAAQVCYSMVVNVTAAGGGTILNSATIDSLETPPTTQTESTAVAVVTFNQLNFSKTDDVDPITSGSNLTYELCYDNTANTNAVTGVTITDDIPAGTTFVSATGPFTSTATDVTWNIGAVAGSAAQVFYNLVVNVTAADGETIVNSAIIDSGETDPLTATETTAVSAGGDIHFVGKGGGSLGPIGLLFGLLALLFRSLRRMNRIKSTSALAISGIVLGTAMTTTASAANNDWYYGIGVGAAHTDTSGSQYDADLLGLGYTASSSLDNDTLGWKLFAGYPLNNTWDIELAYINRGDVDSKTDVSNPALPTGVEQQSFVDNAVTVHPYSVDGLSLTGKANFTVNNKLSLFAKVGLFAWRADVDTHCVGCVAGVSASDSESGTDLTAGVGALYKVTNKVGIRAEYERFGTDRDDIDFVSLGIQINF